MSSLNDYSLDDECSEVWERNFSVRSASLESLSCEESESLPRQLLWAMNPSTLSRLKRSFRKGRLNTFRDVTRRVEVVMRAAAADEGIHFAESEPRGEDTLWIEEETFVHSLETIFGHHKYTTHAHQLFQLLDPFGTRRVSWSSLVEKLVAVGARKTWSRRERWRKIEDEAVPVRRLRHCKRETIVKLVCIETEESFCYAAVSRGGRVGVYSGDLQLLHTYELWHHRSGLKTRVKNAWVTDAIYLSDVQCVLITASDRSLTFYDASILTHAPVYCITGMPNIPTCCCYRPSPHPDAPSTLTLGDERGDVTTLLFTRPRVALFYKAFADKINCYFWRELLSPPHSPLVHISRSRPLARSARRVQCARRGVAACALSEESVRVWGGVGEYVYRVTRGVTCFQIVPSLSLLVTGSPDGIVRLWEICQPSEPTALLQTSGRSAVLDVAVVVDLEIVVAFCKNCWVDIWDLYEECLLQTVRIKFPFLGVLGKKVEFGSYCIHPGPALASPPTSPRRTRLGLGEGDDEAMDSHTAQFSRPSLLVTCCDYVARLPLAPPPTPCARPPPADTRRARGPGEWGLGTPSSASAAVPAPHVPVCPSVAPALPPVTSHKQDCSAELELMLENAGLRGILEKDFVLMMGLKNDLNQKLAELRTNMTQMSVPVGAGAPYLALNLHEPVALEPVDEMTERYREVLSLFPPPSVTASSPRSQRSDSSERSRLSRISRSTRSSRY